jgi:hypothetical protein
MPVASRFDELWLVRASDFEERHYNPKATARQAKSHLDSPVALTGQVSFA